MSGKTGRADEAPCGACCCRKRFRLIKKERNMLRKEGQVRIPSGCAIAAVISKNGTRMSGELITNAMRPMHERSNGLGGGFAGYGIYPDYKEFYALHLFFDSRDTRKKCEAFLREYFEIVHSERIPTRKMPEITDEYAQSVADRYIELYEHIVGEKFVPADSEGDIARRIERNVTEWLNSIHNS